MKLTSPSKVKKILDKYGVKTKKKLGQNFIVDENVLNRIVDAADLGALDVVLEVGGGIGTLTEALANRVKKVITVEMDEDMIEILEDTILKRYDNVELLNEDALKLDFERIFISEGESIKIVANLPYNITTPLLMELVSSSLSLNKLVLTVQKEAADRFLAEKGQGEYGAASVVLDYFFEKEFVMKLVPTIFFPPPRVDSAVIKLKSRERVPIEITDKKLFIDFVRSSFSKRRKTLKNNLKSFLPLKQEEIKNLMKNSDIEPEVRPQDLDALKFARIFNLVYNKYGRSIF